MAMIAEVQPAPLSEAETADLSRLESAIERGMASFLDVAESLVAIRDRGLYRGTHATFDAYLRSRWAGISRSHAHRLLAARGVVAELAADPETPPVLPANLAQTRPLQNTALSPDQKREAWSEAVREAGGQPTERQVASAVQRIISGDECESPKGDLNKPSPMGVDAVLEDEIDIAEAKAALAEGGSVSWEDLKAEMGLDESVEEVVGEEANETDAQKKAREEREWLDTLGIRSNLDDRCRVVYDADVLEWRRENELVEQLRNLRRYHEGQRPQGQKIGRWAAFVGRLVRLPHPRDWLRCLDCIDKTTGLSTGRCGVQDCDSCKGRGYNIPGV